MKTSIFALCLIFANFAAHADYLGRATWKRLDLRLRLIPKGGFTMGSPPSEKGRFGNEEQVEVTITRDFQMMATEVTQRQWVLVTGFNPSHFKNPKDCPDSHTTLNGQELCPNHPVENVFWEETQDFLKKLNAALNLWNCRGTPQDYVGCFRLPTEAEWERAARAGSATAYHFGDDPKNLGDYAWFDENSRNRSHPVASKLPNPFGLHDMHGNMLEWVQDWYAKELLGGRDPLHGRYGSGRVLRGGGWNYYARGLRSAFRTRALRYRASYIGFRLVRGRPPLPRVSLEELDLRLRPISKGSFTMGSPPSEKGRDNDEDQVEVTISKDFQMMATELTQRQWVLVMGKNPSHFKKEKHCPDTHAVLDGQALCPNHPVENVSWSDAQNFVDALNSAFGPSSCQGSPKDLGGCFRLPTEAEWERAARAGSGTAYHFGDDPEDLGDYAWFKKNFGGRTHQVGLKNPNPFGLHDIYGNVWEWTQDRYSERLRGGADPLFDDSKGTRRVFRGGGWPYPARQLRSAHRGSYVHERRYSNGGGFRLVRNAP